MKIQVRYSKTEKEKEKNFTYNTKNLFTLLLIVWKARKGAESVSVYFNN